VVFSPRILPFEVPLMAFRLFSCFRFSQVYGHFCTVTYTRRGKFFSPRFLSSLPITPPLSNRSCPPPGRGFDFSGPSSGCFFDKLSSFCLIERWLLSKWFPNVSARQFCHPRDSSPRLFFPFLLLLVKKQCAPPGQPHPHPPFPAGLFLLTNPAGHTL